MDRRIGATGEQTMMPLRSDDNAIAEKSETYTLCRRVEQAKGRPALYAALDDFTEYLTWLKAYRSRDEFDELFKGVADASDEESVFAALEDVTAYLTNRSENGVLNLSRHVRV